MRILVLAGGESAEREVSLHSGTCVAAALSAGGHDVTLIDPAQTRVRSLRAADFDIAAPLVHGTGGEDGVLLRQLEQIGLPWIGSSVAASELTFDKIRTNQLLKANGLPVPPHVVATRQMSVSQIRTLVQPLGQHVVTKPPQQGSSIGVTIVSSDEELTSGLESAFAYGDRCLIERFIEGRELTVALLDDQTFPVVEILPSQWYDYHSKYHDDTTQYRIDESPAAPGLRKLARQACRLCEVCGISRVDVRVDPDGQPWILEINTIPGMTEHSLVPMAARAEGLGLGDLWEQGAAAALARQRH